MDELLGLIGASPPIEALRGAIRKLSAHGGTGARLPTVLITGETGTGKGLIAHLIHRVSPRAEGPFVDVNCAAIPETLLEAELFGYERGAFTDAHRSKPGLLQTAHGGTIFLDEIGLLSAPLQAKLLKVTEERVVRRLGATRTEPITARLISATNADLLAATRDHRFREDLYHRLAVVTLDLPPLRDREQDVVLLAEHFLARACHDYGLPARVLSPDARRRLLAYRWPGNVRELANIMERTALLAESTYVTAKELDLPAAGPAAAAPAVPEPPAAPGLGPAPARMPTSDSSSLDGVTRAHVQAVLDECGGNISRTAAALGITRTTLRSHIRKFGLEVGVVRPAGRPRTWPVAVPSAVAPLPVGPPASMKLAESPAPAPAAAAAPVPAAAGAPVTLRWEQGLIGLLSVSLSATPETSDYQLASLVQELMATATSFGGRVEELAPLGLVVAFGIDRIEDGPRRAAYAGLAARKAVERRQPPMASVAIRCAIDVSRCLVAQGGAVGMDMAAKRAALAGLEELLGAADAGAVLVTARAVPLLERRFELVPSAGRDGRAAFELVGRERTGLEVGGRTLSRFVGRETELAELYDRLAEAAAGQGRVVGIVGEPGVGKSRLLYELRRSLSPERVRFVSGRCLPHGRTSPYMPIVGLVRETFGLEDDADVETARTRLAAGLAALGLAPDQAAQYLLPLLGFKEGAEAIAALTPAVIKSRTVEAVKQVCIAASARQPVVWAVEDLHWIDRSSEDVLDAIAAELPGRAVLLVTTYRVGHRPPWLGRAHASERPLGRLSSGESLAVLESVLPDAPAALGERIVARADGVPLFIEELARALSERTGDAAAIAVPDTLQGVLTARLDHLAAEDRELLQAASVIGRDVPLRILAEVAERPAGRLEDALARLRAAEFIHDADGASIASVKIGRQARVTAAGGEYAPLIHVKGLPCWPSEPLYAQLAGGEALRGHDFESFWNAPPDVEEVPLTAGRDYDRLVFGISLGAVPYLCDELIAASPRWKAMVDHVATVQTQAFQLWLTSPVDSLGWKTPQATMGSYVEPFDTYADMRQVLAHETWPVGGEPRSVAYFCNVLPTPPGVRPAPDPAFPRAMADGVKASAIAFLREHMQHFWPEAYERGTGEFRWDLLTGGQGAGVARFDSQYWRANVNPSDRYVLSLPGTNQFRMKTDETGFANLYVVGDWIDCGFNLGCVEAAVMSGLLGSHAIRGVPALSEIVHHERLA